MRQDNSTESEGFGEVSKKLLQQSLHSMEVPEGYFEKKAAMLEYSLNQPFEVPTDYFESQHSAFAKRLNKEDPKRPNARVIRLWVSLAAAAMLAGFVIMLIPDKRECPSFSEQLQNSELEFEDLEQIDFDEEVYEEFTLSDTLTPDTVSATKLPASVNDFKPSKGQSVISWDDIDAEDIEEYLNEEESLEIIDEL